MEGIGLREGMDLIGWYLRECLFQGATYSEVEREREGGGVNQRIYKKIETAQYMIV